MKKLNNKGTTLLELLIVVAIIAILSAIILPPTDLIERWALESTSTNLKSDLQYVQRLSMSSGQSYRLSILPNKTYLIFKTDSAVAVKTVRVSTQITSISSNYTGSIEYTTKGRVTKGGTILLCTKKFQQSLTINVGSGRVSRQSITQK